MKIQWLTNFLKKLIKRKLFWAVLIIVIIIYIVISRLGGEKGIEYVTEKVILADLIQTVSETGSVQATTEIDLNFKGNGTVVEVSISEGDEVAEGQILARLDAGNLEIQIRQSQASLDIARANLNILLAGASSQDLNVSQETVNNAWIAYENAKIDHEILLAKVDADIKTFQEAVDAAQKALDNAQNTNIQNVDDAKQNLLTTIRAKANFANTTLDFINYQFLEMRQVSDQQAKINTWSYYEFARDKHIELSNILIKSDLSLSDNEISQSTDLAIRILEDLNISLNSLYNSISSTIVDARYSQVIVDNNKVLIKSEQTTNSTNLSALQAADQAYELAKLSSISSSDSAQSNFDTATANLDATLASKNSQIATSKARVDSTLGSYNLAKAQLEFKKAPARGVDVNYYQAQVNQAQAALDLVVSNLDNFMIKAPTDGLVTFVNYDVGEQIGIGLTTAETKPFISMLGKGEFEIEVDVPESDIIKVKVGDKANITLDAYGDDYMFEGKVVFVDLAETNIQGVIYYKVTVEIDSYDLEIKPGMTANVDIVTNKKENVLLVPSRAIKEDAEGKKYVEVLSFGSPKRMEIETGLRGDEGIEITSGIKEGQEIIIYKREKK